MQNLLENLHRLDLEPWREGLETLIRDKQRLLRENHGRYGHFKAVLATLPDIRPAFVDLDSDRVSIGRCIDISADTARQIENSLRRLGPWRKGPFDVFGIQVESEWSSHLKWNRLKHEISPLGGKRILDIGSSNGYYMFRMAALAAEMVLGIEPYPAYYSQFCALQHFARCRALFCLPAALEEFPAIQSYFDTIFCMGILYHRSSPLDTLHQIREYLKPGGELVLETLIIDGDSETALFPRQRYAKMNNVYFLPTVPCLINWMQRAGFTDTRCIDISRTTLQEQSRTDWIDTESLADFLDPANPQKTVEGYPAPERAMVIGKKAYR